MNMGPDDDFSSKALFTTLVDSQTDLNINHILIKIKTSIVKYISIYFTVFNSFQVGSWTKEESVLVFVPDKSMDNLVKINLNFSNPFN